MVLVHKLKQMEQLDIEQFRQDEDEEENYSEPPKAELPPTSQKPKRASSPPRRPLTRSQTGRVSKRKQPDDSSESPNKSRNSSPRKKPKPAPKPAVEDEPEEPEEPPKSTSPAPEPTPPPPSTTRDPSESSVSLEAAPLNPTQLTFLESNTSSGAPNERRGPRSRAVLPVPVPNLTKKSRGRRVPTKVVADNPNPPVAITTAAVVNPPPTTSVSSEGTRLYVCQVEGCGKCFHRGEHLKRHIRSIHTYEKPFQCTHLGCEKFFNRHDNLLQHLKVHKAAPQAMSSSLFHDMDPNNLQSAHARPPISESLTIPMHKPEKPLYQPPTSFITYSTTTPYGASLTTLGFSTNMAVSSLRTELPPPPTHVRQPESVTTPFQQNSQHAIQTTNGQIATMSHA